LSLRLTDLLAALALLLVIDGIMPFLNPGAVKRMLARVQAFADRDLRLAGFVMMLFGVALLFLIS